MELSVSSRRVRQLIASDRLPATRNGRGWDILRTDLEHYKAAHAVRRD